MADLIYNKAKACLFGDGTESIDLENDTLKLMLVTSAYTPDKDHNYRSSVTNEVAGAGYTAGGATLAGKTVTQDNTNDKATFDANDVQWTGASFTARGAILYKDTGAAATDILIGYFDYGADKTVSGGNFDHTWSASGILDL